MISTRFPLLRSNFISSPGMTFLRCCRDCRRCTAMPKLGKGSLRFSKSVCFQKSVIGTCLAREAEAGKVADIRWRVSVMRATVWSAFSIHSAPRIERRLRASFCWIRWISAGARINVWGGSTLPETLALQRRSSRLGKQPRPLQRGWRSLGRPPRCTGSFSWPTSSMCPIT